MSGRRHAYGSNAYDTESVDSQFTDLEEVSFLEACVSCDDDILYEIIQNGVTWEQVNERDKSGRTGLSHACANGFMPILELLVGVEDVDPNLADKDGNTALIFAAQAGHDDVVNFLLRHFRRVCIDQCNKLGFTALMKAAIQGRTKCAKQLLASGANPSRRDRGRGLCAEQWARFCGCHNSAEAISKYVHSKKYFFKRAFLMTKDKWSSEPDLASSRTKPADEGDAARGGRPGGNWIQRHLSLKRKSKNSDKKTASSPGDPGGHCGASSVAATNRSGSAPLLITISPAWAAGGEEEEEDDETGFSTGGKSFRRPSCIDGVVPVSIVPKLRVTTSDQGVAGAAALFEDREGVLGTQGGPPPPQPPPTITVAGDSDGEADPASKPLG